MTDIELDRLVQVPLRDVWKHEAHNFTLWLAKPDNLAYLGTTIEAELVDPVTEKDVGKFRLDILARDEIGRTVVIENQLEPTNHDHLGKIITYAAGLEAAVIVWVVEYAREEHEQAVNWLNEHTTEEVNFFLIQVEAWKIGDSKPAPRFNIIAKPNGWAKAVKHSVAGGTGELQLQQRAFFERLREYGIVHAPAITRWPKAQAQHWYDIPIGSSLAHVSVTVNSRQKQVAAEIYINDSKALFHRLHAQKAAIEQDLGHSVEWQELPAKKASRIIARHAGDFLSAAESRSLVVWLVETSDHFAQVFPKYF